MTIALPWTKLVAAEPVCRRPSAPMTAREIGVCALRALHRELLCYPKPGLVSPMDTGSHPDMDASLFMSSILALRHYFPAIAAAGGQDLPFAQLRALGRAAEQRMLRATAGVNTHRGAIFNLGLLAAAAGWRLARGAPLAGRALGETVRHRWGEAIGTGAPNDAGGAPSHGSVVAHRYGVGGARAEAAAGFPHVFNVGLPALRATLARGAGRRAAVLQSFFSLLAVLPDTNLLYRGGTDGLAYAQAEARAFLAAGGTLRDGWHRRAAAIHRGFTDRRLSPGGSADLLAATLLVDQLQRPRRP